MVYSNFDCIIYFFIKTFLTANEAMIVIFILCQNSMHLRIWMKLDEGKLSVFSKITDPMESTFLKIVVPVNFQQEAGRYRNYFLAQNHTHAHTQNHFSAHADTWMVFRGFRKSVEMVSCFLSPRTITGTITTPNSLVYSLNFICILDLTSSSYCSEISRNKDGLWGRYSI